MQNQLEQRINRIISGAKDRPGTLFYSEHGLDLIILRMQGGVLYYTSILTSTVRREGTGPIDPDKVKQVKDFKKAQEATGLAVIAALYPTSVVTTTEE